MLRTTIRRRSGSCLKAEVTRDFVREEQYLSRQLAKLLPTIGHTFGEEGRGRAGKIFGWTLRAEQYEG